MARLSDQIESLLLDMLEENDGLWEFSRNSLADQLNCVPSQISYVLSTRFSPVQGYIIKSRRGGGGSVVLRRVEFASHNRAIAYWLDKLPDSMTQAQAFNVLDSLSDHKIIEADIKNVMQAAVAQRTLSCLPADMAGKLRSQILRGMLTGLLLTKQDA